MKYIGMVIGGVFSAIGHMIAFMFKNIFIAIRRFTMDPANKNIIWNLQAFFLLGVLILLFFWLIGKYQDQFYGLSDPIFYRSIPLLIPCFLGHIIYSCPALFKNNYSKPVIQTFLNAFSGLALGQIILTFLPFEIGMLISISLVILIVVLTLYYTLHFNIKSTVFNKLTTTVEQADMFKMKNTDKGKILNMVKKKDSLLHDELYEYEGVDLNKVGCLSHLRYYSEECKLELFSSVPTKDRQSQLMVLSRSDRAQHGQIIGGTGAGKTLLATNLITQDLLNDYIGSTIIEPKGSLINRLSNFMERTGRPYYRLDPEYEFTDCLNPFFVPDGQDIEPMIEANVSAFHGYLGPDAVQYFKSRSTQLMRVCIKALKIVYGNDCGYNELDRLVQPLNDDFRAEVLAELRGHENQVPLLLEYTRNMAGSAKMQEHAMQTYSNLYDYLTELTSNKYIQKIFCGKSTFNIDDALRNGEVILVNGAYGTLQTLTYTVGRLFLNLLRASTFRRNLKEAIRAHQLTVDEIEMFADEEFSTFMEMAREFEVFVNVIHQGNEQLTDVSKRLGAMVKQNAVQKFILAGLENEDAEYYANMIGEDYMIGQSSGTDEMSASGFKTQIKEEKRYTVMPKHISNLKGYNPETGEPGECLFRGVHNNIRLDPVIGLVYPLPRKLFSPINKESELISNTVDEEKGESVSIEVEKEKLEIIKMNALNRRNKTIKDEGKIEDEKRSLDRTEAEVLVSDSNVVIDSKIRNSIWDSGEEVAAGEDSKPKESSVKFTPATIDDTTLKLAERIKNASEDKRMNKGNKEAE